MSILVLDASAIVDILTGSRAGESVTARLPQRITWWVPDHYFAEVAGALRRSALRGDITDAESEAMFTTMIGEWANRVPLRALIGEAWTRRGHLTIADALYVVLTERLDATLVTTDGRLARSPGLTVPMITGNA